MSFICQGLVCSDCGIFHMKEPHCGGDYHRGQLLSYCPNCGGMLPLLDGVADEKPSISKRKRRKVGVRIAKIHQLSYKQMYKLVEETTNRDDFAESLCFKIGLVFGVDIKMDEIQELL